MAYQKNSMSTILSRNQEVHCNMIYLRVIQILFVSNFHLHLGLSLPFRFFPIHQNFASENFSRDFSSLINFRNNYKCSHIIISANASEIIDTNILEIILYNSKEQTIFIEPFLETVTRNVITGNFSKSVCENYIFLCKFSVVVEKFRSQPLNEKPFFPLTQLYFWLDDALNESLLISFSRYLHENVLFGYGFGYEDNKKPVIAVDFLNIIKMSISEYKNQMKTSAMPEDLMHPFLNQSNASKVFRVSLYNVPPYVIYDEAGNKTK